MTRRDWLARAGKALPFLPALPVILSRAQIWTQRAIRLEWEERGYACFATVIRLRTGEIRAKTDQIMMGDSWAGWRYWREFHHTSTELWIKMGTPSPPQTMRDLLARPDARQAIMRLARQP